MQFRILDFFPDDVYGWPGDPAEWVVMDTLFLFNRYCAKEGCTLRMSEQCRYRVWINHFITWHMDVHDQSPLLKDLTPQDMTAFFTYAAQRWNEHDLQVCWKALSFVWDLMSSVAKEWRARHTSATQNDTALCPLPR